MFMLCGIKFCALIGLMLKIMLCSDWLECAMTQGSLKRQLPWVRSDLTINRGTHYSIIDLNGDSCFISFFCQILFYKHYKRQNHTNINYNTPAQTH